MINILKTRFLLLIRRPGSFILLTITICLFSFIMGLGQQAKQPIAVHSLLDQKETNQVIKALEKLSNYEFTLYEKNEAIKLVEQGRVDVAIVLQKNNYDLLVSPDFMNATLLQNELNRIFSDMFLQSAILNTVPIQSQDEIIKIMEHAKANPTFEINYRNFENENGFKWDGKLHSLLGFALFMVIYTIQNGVNHIVMERRNGIWNRLTVSSVYKWEVYIANLTYTFLLGYLQIVLVFSIFNFGVGVNFYGGFVNSLIAVIPYLLCIVALCIFVASVTSTPGKFNAVMTVLSVPFAMLGGAYWPLEVVSSKVIVALSYISPITYGLEILKGVTINGSTIAQLFQPLSLLLFMTVVFMGIGINVLEKKG